MRKGLVLAGLAALFATAFGWKAQCAVVVDAIEVVQTVQDINSPVPIVAGKPTLVRAYVHSTSGRLGLHAELAIDSGGGVSGSIPSTAEVIVTEGEKVADQRMSLTATLDFLLAPKYLTSGDKTLSLTHLTDGQHVPVMCTNCASQKVTTTFVEAPPLHVHVLLVSYTYGPSHTTASPRQVDVDSVRSWLTRAFPTGSVVLETAPFISTDAWPFTCTQLNAQLIVARRRDMESRSADQRTHYLALVPNTDGFMVGCASDVPQDQPNPAVVASVPSGPPHGAHIPINATPETDASFAGWYGGHELMHTLGRAHPGMCNNNSADDDNFPAYARWDGQISPRSPVSVFAYDIGATPGGTHLLSGLAAHDIMTYCSQPDWPSPYTYVAALFRLKAEYAISLPAVAPVASLAGAAASAPAQPGGAGEKPAADGAKAAARGPFVAVQAIVNFSLGSAALKFVNQSARGPNAIKLPAAGKPTAQLRFIDDKGAVISSYVVAVNPASDAEPGRDKLGLISSTIPEPMAASKIELWFNEKLADSRDIFDVKPLVKKLAATGGAGSPLTIQWNFVNPNPTAKVSYDVQTSQNGYIWSTFMVGLRDDHLTLTPDLAKIPWFRVIANDGVHNSEAVVVKHPAN